MKSIVAAAIVTVIGTGAWAKPVADDSAPVVTVCMDSFADAALVYKAKAEASMMFMEVPVRIAWKNGRACQASDAIHVHMRDQTPASLKPGALAYALPIEGTYIELFFDRIQDAVPNPLLPHLLAHVLVHEITHILQGVARHSETGVMKAHWTPADYRVMSVRPLPFAVEDIQLIQAGLRTRGERLEASARASRPR